MFGNHRTELPTSIYFASCPLVSLASALWPLALITEWERKQAGSEAEVDGNKTGERERTRKEGIGSSSGRKRERQITVLNGHAAG